MAKVKSGWLLPSDDRYNNQDRKDFNLLHKWQINDYLTADAEYHYVSDKDYITDLDTNPDSKTDLNLRRALTLKYKNQIPGLTAQLKVEDYQTLDKTILDADKPYARLPQFLLNYVTGNPLGLQYEYNNDTAYFKNRLMTTLHKKAAVHVCITSLQCVITTAPLGPL